MKCAKCGFECGDGTKFCDECGAELPQVKSCPKCHAQLSVDAKFCDACGYDFSNKQKDGEVAISMGDKNVVAGDVVAHKESFKISGNATIVRNEDASKKMVQCSICGKNIPISESFECQDCHQIVCESCFDKTAKKCKKCEGAGQGKNEELYRAAIAEALSDGKIDVSDRKKLMALQKQLGISVAKAVQIEKEMKPASGGGESKNSAAFDKANTDKAYQLLYIKGDYKKAAELMAPVCERHPEDENALSIYLAALTRFNPVKAKTVVAGLHADVLCGALALIDIDIKHKDFPSAEKRIATSLGLWPDSALLKCRKVVYAYELFKVTEDSAPLMEASEIIESIDAKEDAVVKSWKFYAKRIVDSALGEEVQSLDRAQCERDGLLWDVVSSGEDKSSSLYRIIDVSAGPDAKFYPTYYMDTESVNNWSDEFKTDLIVMRHIKPGSFKMGSELGAKYHNPEHLVTLTHSFYIGVYEVTQRQWELVTGKRPSCFKNDQYYAKRPVEQISYEMVRGKRAGIKWPVSKGVDSDSFLGVLRKKTELKELDIPTESQWEYACRAGTTTDYYDGFNIDEDGGDISERLQKIARCCIENINTDDDGFSDADLTTGTSEVGSLSPNAWGLFDMLGNVEELCLDENIEIQPYREVNPEHGITADSDMVQRTSRGGCWRSESFEEVAVWYGQSINRQDSQNWVSGLRLAVQLQSNADVLKWADCEEAQLSEMPPEIIASAIADVDNDMAATYLYARCLMKGCAGLNADENRAEKLLEDLSQKKFPSAQRVIAKSILVESEKQNSSDLRRQAKVLFQEAADAGDSDSLAIIKQLTKLSPECAAAVAKIFKKWAQKLRKEEEFNIPDPDARHPSERIGWFIDAVKESFGYSDEMISRNVLALLEHEDSHVSRGAMFTDDGIYLMNGADNPPIWKPSVVLQWDEFIERGFVKKESIGYVKIFDEPESFVSVWSEFVGEIEDAVTMLSEVYECVKSFNKFDSSTIEKWSKFPVDELNQISREQFAELDALAAVGDPGVEFRRGICLENGFGCEVRRDVSVIKAYRAACRSGSAEAASRLVKYAARGKDGFGTAVEKFCAGIRKSIEDGIIKKFKNDPSFASKNERAQQITLKLALSELDQIIIVGHDVVSGLIDGVMSEFAKGVEHGSAYAPAKPLALIPSPKRDQTHGLVVATEGIYVVNNDAKRRPNAYLSWEELVEHAVLKVDSKRKFDFVITDKPERVVLGMVGMHLNEEALRTMLNGLIECAKKGFDSYVEDDPTRQSVKPELNAQQSKPAKPQKAPSQVNVSTLGSCQKPMDKSKTNPVTRTGDTSSAKADTNGTAKIAHRCKLEISQVLVKTGFKKFATLESLQKADRSMLRDPSKFKNYDESFVLDAATIKVFVDGRQILCEELDPDNDETAIAYEDDGELFTEGLNVEGDEVLLFVQKSCKRTRLSEFEIAGDFVPAKLKIVYRTFSHTSEDDFRVVWSLRYDGKNVGRKFVGDAPDSDRKSWIESEDEYGEFDVWSKPVSENLPSAPTPSVSENDAEPEEVDSGDGHVSDRKRILFFIIGILFGFLGFHFKYAHRRILFHLTWLLLVATGVCMAMKKEMIGAGLGVVWFILWIGCTFFMKKDGSGRKMNWFKSIK